MRPRPRTLVRSCLGPAFVIPALLLAGPASADRRTDRPALLARSGQARLELPSGERVAFALPAGAELWRADSLADAWVAAGTRPGARGQREIDLFLGAGGEVSFLPPPPGRTGRLRAEPLPLVADGRLAGLAWLEGGDQRSLAVRVAAWDGERWQEPETVAPPGPGSQLALAAARLADGSWLLAWSAFDGQDDEILWTRGRPGAWRAPRRAAAGNAVPDVTPALLSSGNSALLAWSRYDGEDYRVVVATFAGDGWREPRTIGPAGSLFPTFEPAARPTLLFRTALPSGWALAELDAAGRPRRAAAVSASAPDRPLIRRAPEGGERVVLRWPGGEKRTARWERRP